MTDEELKEGEAWLAEVEARKNAFVFGVESTAYLVRDVGDMATVIRGLVVEVLRLRKELAKARIVTCSSCGQPADIVARSFCMTCRMASPDRPRR